MYINIIFVKITFVDNKRKILLVEDDVFMLELLSDKLRKSGFEVSVAVDGEECMKVLQSIRPDLVLLDIVMPKVDGLDVLRRMKGSPDLSGIPVIVLSNLGQKEEVERAMDLGAKDYIIKANFTAGEIVEKLNKILK